MIPKGLRFFRAISLVKFVISTSASDKVSGIEYLERKSLKFSKIKRNNSSSTACDFLQHFCRVIQKRQYKKNILVILPDPNINLWSGNKFGEIYLLQPSFLMWGYSQIMLAGTVTLIYIMIMIIIFLLLLLLFVAIFRSTTVLSMKRP